MDANLKTGIWQQFGASIDFLADTMNACPDELWQAAKVCRMTNVLRPYLEATA